MKAILVNPDKTLRWDEVPEPAVGERDVLIDIEYAALNRADLMQREGDYPPPPGAPEWMGLEVSGTVAALGSEAESRSRYRVGDKVCALLGGGGYAERVAAPYDMCMPVPRGRSMAEAAAMPEAFATAYLKLFIEGKAVKGETLLMQAGASGLASVVIPMAKAFGLRVITTVITDPGKISHLGADLVVDTRTESLPRVLAAEEAAGRAVDVAVDCLGGETLGECLPYVKYGCRWVVIASLAGDKTTVDLKNLYKKNIRIIGSTLRSRTPKMKALILRSLVEEVWPKVEAGEILPTVYKVLPVTEAEAAQDILYRGENVGKVVLKVK